MKNFVAFIIVISLILVPGCRDNNEITIAIPNDPTNEARALFLLQENGVITLKKDSEVTSTILDIEENPMKINFREIEAAQIPNVREDVDFAVINSNFAIDAGLNPITDALAFEGSFSSYGNILVVQKDRCDDPILLALCAALKSRQVSNFIKENYNGAIASVVENPGNGFDPNIDYESLRGKTVTVAASPVPHSEILQVAKELLETKDIHMDIKIFTDYVQPNLVTDIGEVDANYFQHLPYMNDFNNQNGTKLVSLGAIHVEPMGIYGGKLKDLSIIQ